MVNIPFSTAIAEALACELYGTYLVENLRIEKGLEQLELAREKYLKWGALKKVLSVEEYMDAHLSSVASID